VVDSISFPDGESEFYSPFAGPASVKFTFNGTENDAVYNVRIRRTGGTAFHSQNFLVDADDPDGFQIKSFDWPAISTTTPRTYDVVVRRDGAVVASESFSLLPPLVRITSASPNPFLPWIDDDYKDETTIRYELLATSEPTYIRIYKANAAGNCCGPKVLDVEDGTHVPGSAPEEFVWDGRGDGGGLQPKGAYFVKITAEDPANVVKTSRPFKVSIARTHRVTATKEKNGILYHHTGAVTSYRRGGNCFVTRDETDKDLWITCLSARFAVYWRWALPQGGRIEQVSFVFVPVSGNICGGAKGHTTRDSFLRVGGVGQFRCRIDKAKITYSVPQAS
jgi:hypothetical protein